MMRSTSASSSTTSSMTWSSLQALLVEQPVERGRLDRGARIAVEDEAAGDVGLVEPGGEDRVDDLVGDQLAGRHHRLGLEADSVPAATAARSMSPVESWTIPRCSTSRLAWVPLPAPGGPRRMMFIAAPRGRPSASPS